MAAMAASTRVRFLMASIPTFGIFQSFFDLRLDFIE